MGPSEEVPAPTSPSLLTGWRPCAILSLLVFAVYSQTTAFELTNLDDALLLKQRLHILRDWSNLPLVFARGSLLSESIRDAYYRPLLTASFMLDAGIGRGSLALFHFSNIVYHALATCLVFGYFRRIGLGDRSLLLAAIFAMHPVLAQAVAWIPGRTDSLLAIFVLASINAFLDYLPDRRTKFLLLHLLYLALALLIKELAVVVPALCLVYAVALGPPGVLRSRRTIALIAGWVLLGVSWFVLRRSVVTPGIGYSFEQTCSTVASNFPATAIYWGKCWLPIRLGPYPILEDAFWLPAIIAGLIVVGLLAVSRPLKIRPLLWGAAWFGVFLLPSFVYPKNHIVPVFFEYRAYLPLIGLLAAVGELRPFRDFSLADRGWPAWLGLTGLLAIPCVINTRAYQDPVTHWERAVEVSPHSAPAHNHLGVAFQETQQLQRAEEEYRKTLALNPSESGVHNNLATLHLEARRWEEAGRECELELALHPRNRSSLFNLGTVRYRLGKPEEAAVWWERTIEVDRDFSDAYVKLASYHLTRKDRERAVGYAREAVQRGAILPPELADLLRP